MAIIPIPVSFPQAVFMHKCAILGPTPGKEHNPSMESGMSLSYLSRSTSDVPLMCFTLVCKDIDISKYLVRLH